MEAMAEIWAVILFAFVLVGVVQDIWAATVPVATKTYWTGVTAAASGLVAALIVTLVATL